MPFGFTANRVEDFNYLDWLLAHLSDASGSFLIRRDGTALDEASSCKVWASPTQHMKSDDANLGLWF